MSDDSDNFAYADDDIDDKKHEKLVENLLNLNKVQHIKKPSRTEPSLQISEFDLVKSATGNKGSVQLNELAKALKGKKLVPITKKVQLTKKKARTLPKPLEKPQTERIKRTVNYEKTRLDLDKWEAVVTSNRAQTHQVFPLESTKRIKIKNAETMPERWRLKSDLQKELDKLEPQVEVFNVETEEIDNYPLTLSELKEKRKEAAKLRAHQSFKEAKARRQNKIKSKKYHRILRREKIKQQLKEFEELQKTDPEEAMKKLEDIDKARAEERFNLRHKSTGQWARNKQIRAKYDKESRQVLAQQLAINRELTQKLKNNSESEDEGIESQVNTVKASSDPRNPWVNGVKPEKEVMDFVSGYRKYWNDKVNQQSEGENIENKSNDSVKDNLLKELDEVDEDNLDEQKQNDEVTLQDNVKGKLKKKKERDEENVPKRRKTKKEKLTLNNSSGEWEVDKDIDELFDELEDNINKKLKKNSQTSNKRKKPKKKKSKTGNKLQKTIKPKADLSLPTKSKKHIIDEEMIERPHSLEENASNMDNINELQQILDSATTDKKSDNMDPDKFMKVKKTTNLDTAMPDILVDDDNNEENSQNKVIMEAFEDADIVRDFHKEKKEEINKDKPKDVDLNLPGWGSWAGAMINSNKRKRRRFIVKMPQKMPRRDDNKGSLIINEKAQAKVRKHQVSEVPFPFQSVKDYEASIRAPIGSTFVPQTAFKKLIQPVVVTKMGTIIEPMKKSMLLNVKNK